MKNKFFGSYKLNDKELRDFISHSQFFFDTNTLLGIYRVKKEMAKKIIASIVKQKARVSISYHVAEEYHKHMVEHHAKRLNEAQEMQRICGDSDRLMKKIFSDFFLNYLQQEEISNLKKIISGFSSALSSFVNEKVKEFNDEFKTMEVASILAEELSDCIIDPLPEEIVDKLKEEFKDRAANNIPPGYKDKSKSKNQTETSTNEAGDYIIWTEMMEWAAKNKKDILFICNEEKTDWIWKECGLRIGPRRELCSEFKNRTNGQKFYIIKLETFLTLTDDQYSDTEIKAIEEETKPVSSTLKKSDFQQYLSEIIYLRLLERIEDFPRQLKEFRSITKNEKTTATSENFITNSNLQKSTKKSNSSTSDSEPDVELAKDLDYSLSTK